MRHLQIEDLKKFGSVPFELSAVAVDYPEYSDISFRLADLSTPAAVIAAFDARIDSIDFDNAREDVLPYIADPAELELWSREFFHHIVRRIKFS